MKKKVLITGASSGIGLAITSHLLSLSEYEVLGIARDFSKTNLSSNPDFSPYELDLQKIDHLPEKLSSIAKKHSDIKSLILCAGIGIFKNLEQLSFLQIKNLLELNLLSNIYICKAFISSLKKQEKANIVFIGSTAGITGKKEGSIYCASKFALRGFAQALREESASSNVRISIIQPGMVNTPFYNNLHFGPKEGAFHSIPLEDIISAVMTVLNGSAVFDEIIITPQKKSLSFK